MSGCLSCGAHTTEVLDLGNLRLPDFLEPGESYGEAYPLRLVICETCTLLQLGDIVPRDAVIHERYGFATGLNEANQFDQAQIAAYALQDVPRPRRWLDIGCNDATLLKAIPHELGVYRVGVDPLLAYDSFAGPACRGDFAPNVLIPRYFSPDEFDHGEFDVVTSAAMFYALPDPSRFVEGVRQVLATQGVWVIQQNYALDMLRNNVIDNVIHEHVAYYSVRALQRLLNRHGMQITDVVYSGDGIKGGCFRALVAHMGARPVGQSVWEALRAEAVAAVSRPETWEAWGGYVLGQLAKTKSYVEGWAREGHRTYCYGAGNRGGTLVQLLDIGLDAMPFAVERAEWKVGKTWNSAKMPIISEQSFRLAGPRYLLVSPWFFRKGFIEREKDYLNEGGTMIFPLPCFEIVSGR